MPLFWPCLHAETICIRKIMKNKMVVVDIKVPTRKPVACHHSVLRKHPFALDVA
jgi:hypothetical protein